MNLVQPRDDIFNVVNEGDSYYGINVDGHVVFISPSLNKNIRSSSQETKHLYLSTNTRCSLKTTTNNIEGFYNILICKEREFKSVISFLQLTDVYSKVYEESGINIRTFFETLKNLFSNKKQLPLIELQGLYGELFIMEYLRGFQFDISKYWQSKEKMKFDFSISDVKKIEIKTTTGDKRIHKFRHEQLVSDIYDTWIVSIMLRKDDKGLSLYQLAEDVKKNNPKNLNLHTRITNLLNNYTVEELEEIKFNKDYSQKNIGFFRTTNIPKFPEKQPSGVTNTEYDSDLGSTKSGNVSELLEWIDNALLHN